MTISGLLHVNINCSDFERSRAFYEMLGFELLMPVPEVGEGEVAAAVGMTAYRLRGALMKHRDGSLIDLLEWREPADDAPPYAALNHLGLARVALQSTDIDADIGRLRAAGVEFLTAQPATVAGPDGMSSRFICFTDPDGTVLELVELPG